MPAQQNSTPRKHPKPKVVKTAGGWLVTTGKLRRLFANRKEAFREAAAYYKHGVCQNLTCTLPQAPKSPYHVCVKHTPRIR